MATEPVDRWFAARDWQPFAFQREVWAAMLAGRSGLLHATTGSGKTYAVGLGALLRGLARHESTATRGAPPLQVLWITPMRALASDTTRALGLPLADLAPHWTLGQRSGDTPSAERARQDKRLPTVLVTTPESLSLMLTREKVRDELADVHTVIVGFGRCVRDVALLGAVLTGDARLNDEAALAAPPSPRIGLCLTPDAAQMDADSQAAWAQALRLLAPAAAHLADAPWPAAMPGLVALQKAVMAHEMARSLSHERTAPGAAVSERLRSLFDEGMAIDGGTHAAHLAATAAARAVADTWFDTFDLLLAPSTLGEAPAGIDATGDPLFSRGWSLLGLPCIHLPFARGRNGLPVGLQIVGRWGDDHRLMAAAQWCMARLAG